jgi:hypothetical protein|tara:strand:- start:2699 stop:2944 length:246 start_codon:yes stop_codon:yes gene_type:complete
MKEYKKEHAELVMDTFKALPDIDLTDRKLYDDLIRTLNKYNGEIGNGEVLATLKLIIMQLCEHCADFIEEQKYEELQEKYK